ncbi:MAG: CHAT domain-containing protein [Minicystis sp.]
MGRARALDALARRGDAIAALREAEHLLDRRAPSIPLDAGRAGFLGNHGESALLLSELLVRDGHADAAMRVVRAARARAIASADRLERVALLAPDRRARWDDAVIAYRRERDALDALTAEAWELSADKLPRAKAAQKEHEERARAALDDAFALLGEGSIGEGPPPRDGEVILLYQALGGGPARVFAEDARGVTTSPIDLPPPGSSPEALAHALLAPVSSALARASRIRVLATGPLLRVDVHALPFGDAPLVARAPVVYALDLPGATADDAHAEGAPSALVVADPRNDLAAARNEVHRVEARLSGAFAVTSLLGDAAQRSSVLRGLEHATLFHFGGHGVFAGATGWESALVLADTGALTLGDVLTLPAAPRYVILSGCETGRAPEGSGVVDVSLAHAFASAGAEVVVAAVRPVRDDLAGSMAEALYAGASRPGWDPAAALRDAQRAVMRASPDHDWASYRVVTR